MILRPPFSIRGGVAGTLSPTTRTLEAMGAEAPILTLSSLARSTLTWTQPGSTPAPDPGEAISLFDATGACLFTGTARRQYDWKGGSQALWLVTATDVWEAMERTPLTGTVTDQAGNESIRPLVSFPAGDLRTSILSLLAMAKALGVGIESGEVSPCFEVPPMTFSKATLADALVDMLRFIPDATARMDYSSGAAPSLHVIRRSTATTVSLALGTPADDTLSIRLRPLPEMRPLAVEVDSASYDSEGRLVFGKQTAGDATAEASRIQRLVVSGAENTTSPLRADDTYYLKTAAPTIDSALVLLKDPGLAAINEQYGSVPGAPVTSIARWTGVTKGGSYSNPVSFASPVRLDSDGLPYAATGYNFVIGAEPPDWAIKQFAMFKLQVIGTWGGGTTYANGASPDPDPEFSEMATSTSFDGWATAPASPDTSRVLPGWRQYRLELWATEYDFTTPSTVVRAGDYPFVFPPDNLAANLFAAQDFLPFDGSALLGRHAPVIPTPGDLLSATGGDPEWEAARAPIQTCELDLRLLTASLTLGSPSAINPSTLLDSFRSSARDNVAN